MSGHVVRIGVGVAWVAVLGAWGCSQGAPRIEAPQIDASAASQAAMKQYDADGDGLIAGEELDKAPALKASMATLDADKDKKVSPAEITARINAWKESKLGRTTIAVTVNQGGKPLAGATVKIVPEAFLGPEMKPGKGTTDEAGVASLSMDADPEEPDFVPGVQCGFYRVEITKAGADIPAKYNTETTLGLEVAQGNAPRPSGIVFDLD